MKGNSSQEVLGREGIKAKKRKGVKKTKRLRDEMTKRRLIRNEY